MSFFFGITLLSCMCVLGIICIDEASPLCISTDLVPNKGEYKYHKYQIRFTDFKRSFHSRCHFLTFLLLPRVSYLNISPQILLLIPFKLLTLIYNFCPFFFLLYLLILSISWFDFLISLPLHDSRYSLVFPFRILLFCKYYIRISCSFY